MKRLIFVGIIVGIMASLFSEVIGLKVTDFRWWFVTLLVIFFFALIYALLEEEEETP